MDDIAGEWDSAHIRFFIPLVSRPSTVEDSVLLDITRLTMNQYFDAVPGEEHFGRFLTDVVLRTSMETGKSPTGTRCGTMS